MSGLQRMLSTGSRPGVYHWRSADDADDVRRDVLAAGWNFVLLATSGVADKAGFLDACATAFDLPRWFGRNWEALAESLGDRSTGEPEIVLWQGWRDLAAGDPDALDVALQIFAEDALGSGQLRVLLQDPTNDPIPSPAAHLPQL